MNTKDTETVPAKPVPEKKPISVQNLTQAVAGALIEAVSVFPRRRNPYPQTVAECLDDKLKFRPAVHMAMKSFRAAQPWTGTQAEVQTKFRMLCHDLAEAYEIKEPQIVFVEKFFTGACCFPKSIPAVIIMEQETDGRYSVVTLLHEFGHAIGKGEKGTCRWSLNLFKRYFPKSFAKLIPQGHLLCRQKENAK